MTDPSELVSKIVNHNGQSMRIAGYERDPKRTDDNRNGSPVFLLVEADASERRPPYDNWEQILVDDLLAEITDGNGHTKEPAK